MPKPMYVKRKIILSNGGNLYEDEGIDLRGENEEGTFRGRIM